MPLSLLVLLLSLLSAATPTASFPSSIGVTYRPTNPSHVASTLQSLHVSSVQLPSPDPDSIRSFAYSNISLLLSIPNSLLPFLAQNRLNTNYYVHTHIIPFYPHSRISANSVGTDVFHYPINVSNLIFLAIVNVYLSLHDLDELESFTALQPKCW